ncbi:LAFA_0C03026g1_1 [Lachancea sp. 'fantastica']|nr:LAFA_0C03026g1_1 [Lachancea sp. 'fantastica']
MKRFLSVSFAALYTLAAGKNKVSATPHSVPGDTPLFRIIVSCSLQDGNSAGRTYNHADTCNFLTPSPLKIKMVVRLKGLPPILFQTPSHPEDKTKTECLHPLVRSEFFLIVAVHKRLEVFGLSRKCHMRYVKGLFCCIWDNRDVQITIQNGSQFLTFCGLEKRVSNVV